MEVNHRIAEFSLVVDGRLEFSDRLLHDGIANDKSALAE
jgi:hypothetical protein